MNPVKQSSSRLVFLLVLLLSPTVMVASPAESDHVEIANRLVSGLLSITFDRQDGLPVRYDLAGYQEPFTGKEQGQSIQIAVKKKSGKPSTSIFQGITKTGNGEIYVPDTSVCLIKPRYVKTEFSKNQADARYEGFLNDVQAVSFTIRYLIKDQTVFVSMADVMEEKGYELIELKWIRSGKNIRYSLEIPPDYTVKIENTGSFGLVPVEEI